MNEAIQQAKDILASNKPWGKVNIQAKTDMEALRHFAIATQELGLTFTYESSPFYSAMVAEKDNLCFTIFFPLNEQEKAAHDADMTAWLEEEGFTGVDVSHYEEVEERV